MLTTAWQFKLRKNIAEEILVLMLEYKALCHGICTDVCLDEIKILPREEQANL